LAFPPHIPELKAKTGSCIPPNPNSLHCIQSPPLLFLSQLAVCPVKCSPLKTKSHKSPTAL
jgi:hypothetical protein